MLLNWGLKAQSQAFTFDILETTTILKSIVYQKLLIKVLISYCSFSTLFQQFKLNTVITISCVLYPFYYYLYMF